MSAVTLTDKGSMIVPVAFELFGSLPERLVVGDVPLVRKAELHLTVFNWSIGKLIKGTAQPRLETLINHEAAAFDWKIRPSSTYYHLVRGNLHTVVVMVEAPLSSFYHATRELAGEDAADTPALVALKDALSRPPPPHVTLYTSDTSGRSAIGLNTVAELEGARAGTTPGLRAYPYVMGS